MRAVLINISGGIVHCDMVARGVIEVAKTIGVQVPVVVPPRRYEHRGKLGGALRDSALDFAVANGMIDDAKKIAALANRQQADA